uniref:Putative ribonuclease x25 n=1 Tax=Corethrella appendiculata TaxID=1370023 RepID=U5EP87_9DIPT
MKVPVSSILFLFVISLDLSFSDSSEEDISRSSSEEDDTFLRNENSDFDLFIFTQRWPNTVCYMWREKSDLNQCLLPPVRNQWTVHGIWPTKLNTIGPSFCNKTVKFDVKELNQIENLLNEYWTNIEKNTMHDSLWRHEWLKHGTCAMKINELSDENKYFGQGLKWLDRYSMTNVLKDGNVLPGNNYTALEIHNVLLAYFSKNVAIECYHDSRTKLQFLFEIRICFNKQFELTDCDGILLLEKVSVNYSNGTVITNCNLKKPVFYPQNIPMSKFDLFYERHFTAINNLNEKPKEISSSLNLINFYKLIQLVKWITL